MLGCGVGLYVFVFLEKAREPKPRSLFPTFITPEKKEKDKRKREKPPKTSPAVLLFSLFLSHLGPKSYLSLVESLECFSPLLNPKTLTLFYTSKLANIPFLFYLI